MLSTAKKQATKIQARWIPLKQKRNNTLSTKQVYLRSVKIVTKLGVSRWATTFYIGNEISELIGIKKGERVMVYFDHINPNLLLLQRTTDKSGFRVYQSIGGNAFHLITTLEHELSVASDNKTHPVFHDIYSDDAIIVDVSKKPIF